MQLDQGPPSLSHRGLPNLAPGEKEKLKGLLAKQKDGGVPLTEGEQRDWRDLKDKLRPDVPYDKLHPNYKHLSPDTKAKLDGFNKKLASGVPLSREDRPVHDKIKDVLDDPLPVDPAHPGCKDLTPDEADKLRDLIEKRGQGKKLSPSE